jgi:hypothetical protein
MWRLWRYNTSIYFENLQKWKTSEYGACSRAKNRTRDLRNSIKPCWLFARTVQPRDLRQCFSHCWTQHSMDGRGQFQAPFALPLSHTTQETELVSEAIVTDGEDKVLPLLGIELRFPAGFLSHNAVLQNLSQLTFILQKWRIVWALNNASKWQMGFNSAFKG